jgi:uncharacterized protein (TIGR03435 family)
MTRLLLLFVCASLITSAQPKPSFDVVSIKPVPRPTPESVRTGTSRVGITIEPPRVEIVGFGLNVLLARAFQVEVQQVDLRGLGGTEFFEVQAKMPDGATPDQIPAMLQAMLTERFKLVYHRETRDYSATAISIGKSGMKLPRLPDDTKASFTATRLSDGTNRTVITDTITALFPVMNSFGGFPQAVNETGLTGIYTWVREERLTVPGMTFQETTRESFEAMFDAAGLKLESRKVPRITIVVDSVETKPTEN